MYATADDMRARYGETVLVQLTNAAAWDGTAIAALNVKLADATALADGYVAKVLGPSPTSPIPQLLVRIVCQIAFADLQRAPDDESKAQRAEAMTLLRDISRGLIKLDGGDIDALPARDGAVIVPERERTFSRDRLAGF
ncbi:MAG: hypothetical protein CVT77_06570 [Alphaproteobacteria bacterium HGW-Alphaproteobacteria-16]|nr:MAG: hypothetical protein CVT77_06570 [Alphaproteobacteria bacterium HGW-Alphaproteobacteria-16]